MKPFVEAIGLSAGEALIPLDENDKVFLGSGYDTLTDTLHDGIVAKAYSEPPPEDEEYGQRQYTYIDVVEDASEFAESLNISLKASAKGFGGKASASYSMYRSLKFNTKDVFALFYVKVIDKVRTIYDPGLSDRAKEEWRNEYSAKRKTTFVRTYGDSYISRIVTGGELLALFKIKSSTRKEREEIKASARASFGAFRASGNYQYIKTFFNQHAHTVMEVRKTGGSGQTPKPDLQALIEYALSFPEQVDSQKGGRPVQILAVAKPTSHLQDGNTNLNLSAPEADAIVERLGDLQIALRKRSQEAEFILEAPQLYPQVNKEDIASNLRLFEQCRAKADEAYQFVVNNRFSDLSSIEIPDVRSLPELPGTMSGTVVPLTIHLTGQYVYGKKWDITANGGEWTSFEALFGMRLECESLAPGTHLEYRLIDEKGADHEMTKQGTTAVIAKNAETAVGLAVRVAGENAPRYSVHYAIRTNVGNASFYAQDGEKLTMWRGRPGWIVTGLRIDLYIS